MNLDAKLAAEAVEEALSKFPEMRPYGARLACRPVFGGITYLVEYETQPPAEQKSAWDFQNAAVRAYKRLIGE